MTGQRRRRQACGAQQSHNQRLSFLILTACVCVPNYATKREFHEEESKLAHDSLIPRALFLLLKTDVGLGQVTRGPFPTKHTESARDVGGGGHVAEGGVGGRWAAGGGRWRSGGAGERRREAAMGGDEGGDSGDGGDGGGWRCGVVVLFSTGWYGDEVEVVAKAFVLCSASCLLMPPPSPGPITGRPSSVHPDHGDMCLCTVHLGAHAGFGVLAASPRLWPFQCISRIPDIAALGTRRCGAQRTLPQASLWCKHFFLCLRLYHSALAATTTILHLRLLFPVSSSPTSAEKVRTSPTRLSSTMSPTVAVVTVPSAKGDVKSESTVARILGSGMIRRITAFSLCLTRRL